MARKPKTDHAAAKRAFITGRITRAEYMQCVRGEAFADRNGVWLPREMGWEKRIFYNGLPPEYHPWFKGVQP